MSRFGLNLTLVCSALLTLGTGWYLVAKHRLGSEIATADADLQRKLLRARTENRELQQRVATLAANPPSSALAVAAPPATHPAGRARIVVELIQSGLLGPVSWPSPLRNSLEAGMADLAEMLALTAAETNALQNAMEIGKRDFSAAVLAHAKVERDGPMVTITVNEEPEVRAAYQRLLASIATVLGPERNGYYRSLGAKATIEELFNRWGLEPYTFMVAHTTGIPDAFFPARLDANGNPRPSAQRPRGDPSGRLLYYWTQIKPGPRSGGGVSGTDTLENLGINLRPLHALVPPDL